MDHKTERLITARDLMDAFAGRTGLIGDSSKAFQRYLWTDAYAVQTFLGLADALDESVYVQKARLLSKLVHHKLGQFTVADARKGWISGFSDEEGEIHPTAGGLRIGKTLRERKENEPLDERLEWERDGQYFHYNTRWIHSLQKMREETGNRNYGIWAAELLLACRKFIARDNGQARMYWKMSIDLSRPQVNSTGIHDPLEGLILAVHLQKEVPELAPQLKRLASEFESLSQGRDWKTNDTLGIGGLLLHAVKAAECTSLGNSVPEPMDPEKLLHVCRIGLEALANSKELTFTSARRLAFRECGLSLALRVLFGRRSLFRDQDISLAAFEEFLPLAQEIEEFWQKPKNQDSVLWKKHLDINEVALAASLVAEYSSEKF